MHGWERRKLETRERIVAVAREMIGETGETELSMRPLALRAEVSLATPYNLFGSKGAILQAVLASDVDTFVQRVSALPSADSIERIFDALELAAKVYDEEPKFYRTLFRALFNTGSRDLAAMFNPPRRAFWRGLIEQAIEERALSREVDAGHFALALGHTFGAIVLEWVEQEMSLVELRAAFGFEVALLLSGAATAGRRGALARRAFDFQGQLVSLRAERRRSARRERLESRPRSALSSPGRHRAEEGAAGDEQQKQRGDAAALRAADGGGGRHEGGARESRWRCRREHRGRRIASSSPEATAAPAWSVTPISSPSG